MGSLETVAEKFAPFAKILDVRAFGHGRINDTFLVSVYSEQQPHFILQRVNTRIFTKPQRVMRNLRTVTEHVHQKLSRATRTAGRRWEMPQVMFTREGRDHWRDGQGSFWRAMSFITDSESFENIKNIEHAGEIGYALGTFHTLLSDLSPTRLADTLVNFHNTPHYLKHYDAVIAKRATIKSPEINYGLQFISKRRKWARVLENAKARGELNPLPTHGDPKVNNIMLDTVTARAVSIVDLDTVKPGLIHYDIGDCLRSACNLSGEESSHWEAVRFETDFCRAIMQGYLTMAHALLTSRDYDYLYDAVRLIAFELGLRYFTDYLEGNVYFKAARPEHNLVRALGQFKLTESIESQQTAIRAIVADMRYLSWDIQKGHQSDHAGG